MRPRSGPDGDGQRGAGELAVPVPFSMAEFGACLEERTGRAAMLIPVAMAPGVPSGIFVQTGGADYLFYEEQTSPFHQAHIVVSLAAHAVLDDLAGPCIDRRLVPDVSPQLLRMMLGDDARIATVTQAGAETFAFVALDRAGVAACPTDLARHLLREVGPLHSALLGAVPEASAGAACGCAVTGGAGDDAGLRLYQRVIEIREAMLALRPWRDPDVATAASVAGLAGLAGDELAAKVEAAVLAAAVRARNAGHPVRRPAGDGGCLWVAGPDLRSEADWLVQVSRAFAQVPVAGGPVGGEVLGGRPEGGGLEAGTGAEGLR